METCDIDLITEGVDGAITGFSTVRVTHMLYANDLCLTANRPDQLQTVLNCLNEYARSKGFTINTAMSEVVHFNSPGFNVPAFSVGGAPLASKDSFKYLSMVFYGTHNMSKSAEHMLGPFMAGCHKIRQYVQEHHLIDRPHALLWLTKLLRYSCQYVCLPDLGNTVHEAGQ